MIMKIFLYSLLSILLHTGCSLNQQSDQSGKISGENKPNFVIIFCDDLGYGDVGCFGASDISTPHIDGMADEGMKFTEFYSASPVCSPSRAALMTGRYPQRMGINGVFFPGKLHGHTRGGGNHCRDA